MAEREGALTHITAEQAIELSQRDDMLIDVREQWEWDAGHAPTATHIPIGELHARLSELPRIPGDDDAPMATVMVICHSGGRSLSAGGALADAGYHAINVLGGMTAWQQIGGPMVSAAPSPPSA